MQPTVQQAGLLPVDAERGRAEAAGSLQHRPQARKVHVQRDIGERTPRPRNTANFPEAADRAQQEPTQHRLLLRPVVSEHFDKM